MDPIRDIDPLCPCLLVKSDGSHFRCDMPLGVSGDLASMDFNFQSGNTRYSIPWNGIVAYISLNNPNRRIDVLPNDLKQLIADIEASLGNAIGANEQISVQLQDLASLRGEENQSTAAILQGYAKINQIHRKYKLERQVGGTIQPLNYSITVSRFKIVGTF